MSAIAKLLWLLLALVLFCFAVLAVNQSEVALKFLVWETPQISLFWWLLSAFVLGFVLASIGYSVVSLRIRMQNRALNKRLNRMQQEARQFEPGNVPAASRPDAIPHAHP